MLHRTPPLRRCTARYLVGHLLYPADVCVVPDSGHGICSTPAESVQCDQVGLQCLTARVTGTSTLFALSCCSRVAHNAQLMPPAESVCCLQRSGEGLPDAAHSSQSAVPSSPSDPGLATAGRPQRGCRAALSCGGRPPKQKEKQEPPADSVGCLQRSGEGLPEAVPSSPSDPGLATAAQGPSAAAGRPSAAEGAAGPSAPPRRSDSSKSSRSSQSREPATARSQVII